MSEDDELGRQLAGARDVNDYVLDGAFWPHARSWEDVWRNADFASRPQKFYSSIARNVSGSPTREDGPLDYSPRRVPADPVKAAGGSSWERALLAAIRSENPDDAQVGQSLADVWTWWDANIRGRIHQSPITGLGFYLEGPPRTQAPYPDPVPSPALWIESTQQLSWWTAGRREAGTNHARRQVSRWAELRDLAQPIYREQSAAVLNVINKTDVWASRLTPTTSSRRASLWV